MLAEKDVVSMFHIVVGNKQVAVKDNKDVSAELEGKMGVDGGEFCALLVAVAEK